MKKVLNVLNLIVTKLNDLNTHYIKISSKKIPKKILQIFPHNLYLMILFIVLLIIFIPKVVNNDIIKYKTDDFNGFHEEIVNDKVEQEINTKDIKTIDSLGILFATYMRENDSIYKLEIYEEDSIIYSKKFNAKILKDNKYKYFKTNISKIKSDKKYKYVLTPIKVKKGQGITIIQSEDKELAYSIKNKSEFYLETIIFSSLFFLIFLTINYLSNNNIIKTEKGYILLMLIYIIPSLFIYPAYEVPDEPNHFYRALRLSQYNIIKTPYENMRVKKVILPSNYKCLSYSGIQKYESVKSKDEYLECFNSTQNKKVKLQKSSTSKLLVYIPAAIGIKIADVFSNSPMILFYMGRLFEFIAAFLIMFFALKVIPKYKKLFLLVAMVPMVLQQMISYSYDGILNSLSLLIVAYIIKFYYSKTIEKKDWIIYTLISILVLDIKAPYILLSLPILFMDKNKFGTKKHDKLKKIGIYFLSLFISYLLFKYISNIGKLPEKVITTSRGNSISSLFNIKYLLLLIFNTLRYKGIEYIESTIGIFGWLSIKLNVLMLYSYIVFLFLCVLSEKNDIQWKKRIPDILLLLILIAGIFLALYLDWTPKGSNVVEGVQGRYFLPILLPIMLIFVPKKNKIKIENNTIYNFINISTFIYIITLIIEFY